MIEKQEYITEDGTTQEQLDMPPQIVDDDAGKLVVEELKTQLKRDIEQTEETLVAIQKDIDNYLPQLELSKRLWNKLRVKENFKKIEPTYKYEDDDEYWDIQHALTLYKLRDEEAKSDNTLKGFYTQKEIFEKSLSDLKEKLAKYE